MTVKYASDRHAFQKTLKGLESGDCLEIDSFAAVAADSAELLDAVIGIADRGADLVSPGDGVDTRDGTGAAFFSLCRALRALDEGKSRRRRRDGIEKAKEEGRYRGRKPIEVDEAMFESVVSLWQGGEITAREAMDRLDLKPNTFYRRIKKREEQKIKDCRKAERELRAGIKEAAKQSRRELDEMKKKVRAEAREAKKAAGEKQALQNAGGDTEEPEKLPENEA